MAEPASSLLGITLTATGITLFGVATGLHPSMLLSGLAGGLWALSVQPPAGIVARLVFLAGSALVAAYFTPVVAAVAASAALKLLPWWPTDVTRDVIQFPISVLLGFLALRSIGPALMRRVEKIGDQT